MGKDKSSTTPQVKKPVVKATPSKPGEHGNPITSGNEPVS